MTSRLHLASGSPRRRELLEGCGFRVTVQPPNLDETRPPGLDPVAHARRLARLKALAGPEAGPLLAADTVVHIDDAVFDKPTDRAEARAHLLTLSGRVHTVTTGVCVRRGERLEVFSVSTRVRFRALCEAEVDAYLQTGEADDKAGAYGIQGRGGALVASIEGSWTNVKGLPVEETLEALAEFGVVPWGDA